MIDISYEKIITLETYKEFVSGAYGFDVIGDNKVDDGFLIMYVANWTDDYVLFKRTPYSTIKRVYRYWSSDDGLIHYGYETADEYDLKWYKQVLDRGLEKISWFDEDDYLLDDDE